MMPHKDIQAFLEAEAQAADLVMVLAELKREIESYQSARTALDGVASKLVEEVGQLSALVSASGEIMTTLRNMGTAEVLSRLEAVSTAAQNLRAHQESAITSVQHGIRQLDQAVASMSAALQGHAEALSSLLTTVGQDVKERVGEASKNQEQVVSKARAAIDMLGGKLDASKEATDTALSQLRRLALGSTGLAFITLVIVLWILVR